MTQKVEIIMSRNNFYLFLIAVSSLIIISCSKDDPTSPTQSVPVPVAKLSDIKAKVFTNCLGAQCHSSSGNQGGLNLESGAAYSNLVNVQSVLFPQFKRVESGNSANSLLIKILKGDVSPRMPYNSSPLSSEVIDSIAKWIDDGALNN